MIVSKTTPFATITVTVCVSALFTVGCFSRTQVPEHRTGTSAPREAPKEVFDEASGTTLIIVRRPIVLARSRTDVAANVRDYITLVTVREDQSGKHATWLVAYRWSTLDARFDTARDVHSGRLLLLADGRSLALTPSERAPSFLQHGSRPFAPHFALDAWAYPMDLPTLRYLATARELSARLQDDALPLAYTMWEDGRAQLLGLLESFTP